MDTTFSDTYLYGRKQSMRKGSNAARILGSYFWSRVNKKARISGLPISLSVEPTTSCNLRCPECPSGLRSFTRPTGMIDISLYREILNQLGDSLSYMTLYFQGEPYLHPSFFDMVRLASENNIYTATSTNAHYLDDEKAEMTVRSGLDKIVISLDGTTQETYERYRIGGQLDKVIQGAEKLVTWKKKLRSQTPYTVFQFLLMRHNEHQISEIKNMARNMGIDKVALKTVQVYDHENGSELLPLNERHTRYSKDDSGKFTIKNKLLNHCWRMWQGSVVTWDGKVVPCCFDKDASHVLGDLKEQTFREIWFGEKYNDFRNSLLKGRSNIDICKNCTEGTRTYL